MPWVDALFHKDQEIIEGQITEDGLLIRAEQSKVQHLLDKYPKTEEGWFFNESFDRLIAESERRGCITANPQLVWQQGYTIQT